MNKATFICYDNGGATYDRFTVIPRSREFDSMTIRRPASRPLRMSLGMSLDPTGPRGFSQWSHAQAGPHLGRKVDFGKLPRDVQKHVIAMCD